jgi:hypothetical protein
MSELLLRRALLKRLGVGGLSLAAPALFSGCPGRQNRKSVPLDPIDLPYAESPDFNQRFNSAIRERRLVNVVFDGTVRIRRVSPFFQMLAHDPNLRNRDALIEVFNLSDTDPGRERLRIAFEDDLLRHDRAERRRALPSGNVIEPTTVVLVVVSLLIVASAVAVTTQITLHGPVRASWQAQYRDTRAAFSFEPTS